MASLNIAVAHADGTSVTASGVVADGPVLEALMQAIREVVPLLGRLEPPTTPPDEPPAEEA